MPLPRLVVLFDIQKVNAGAYGWKCWKIFWQIINPQDLSVSSLYDGDTKVTLFDRAEDVYAIGIENIFRPQIFDKIKKTLCDSDMFREVCAYPSFVEGIEAQKEPLVHCGNVDCWGNILDGENGWAADALKSAQRILAQKKVEQKESKSEVLKESKETKQEGPNKQKGSKEKEIKESKEIKKEDHGNQKEAYITLLMSSRSLLDEGCDEAIQGLRRLKDPQVIPIILQCIEKTIDSHSGCECFGCFWCVDKEVKNAINKAREARDYIKDNSNKIVNNTVEMSASNKT